MMSTHSVKFSKDANRDFIKTLRKRVSGYFEANNISKHANTSMVIKTIFMTLLYTLPYVLMITGIITHPILFYFAWLMMGFGVAGIGLSVMHDANHGAYSKNKKTNKYLGYLLNLVGGNAKNWILQHNVLHHSYPNVQGMDEDISPPVKMLRFSPHEKRYKIHKLQYIYAWFFYALVTLSWVTMKEFAQLARYRRKNLIKTQKEYRRLLWELILWKLFYYLYIMVLPIVLLPVSPWFILVCFLSMHFVAGFILGCVFQSAHVIPNSEYPLPDKEGNLENDWAALQLLTTSNFAPDNKLLSWFVGGLNYQIEHHLFPTVCHVHYKKIAGIVEKTACEFNLPYNTQKTFREAIRNHTKMLKSLGET